MPAVRVMFGYADNGERLSITIDEAAWKEMRAAHSTGPSCRSICLDR